MDKYKHVFDEFIRFETHYDGYKLARRDKRYKPEVLCYSANLEANIIDGINHLIWKDYAISGVHEFYEYFPKKRIITAWPFKNRVVNCAAYKVLWPIYAASMYEHSYGSIPGRGQVRACKQLQKWMKKSRWTGKNQWLAKADVAKFFFRIPHEVQLRELGKPLDDPDMMWFLQTCIKGDGRPTGLPLECGDPTEVERIFGIGMPVGSLISQMTANVVMTPVDHYMKRIVRVPEYIRYMDDMVLKCDSKQQAWDAIGMLDDFLQGEMGLQLNNKTAVMKYDDGVEFVGRIVTPNRIDLRKSSSLQMKRHLDYVREAYGRGEVPLEYAQDVIISYLGLLQHTSSKELRDKILEDYVLIRHTTPDN